jgi:signal transduction histidine kinase
MIYVSIFFLELIIDWLSYIQPIAELNITAWNPQVAFHLVFLLRSKANFLPIIIAGIAGNVLIRSADIFSISNVEAILTVAIYFGGMLFFLKFFRTNSVLKDSKKFLKYIALSVAIAIVHAITATSLYFLAGEIPSDKVIQSTVSIIIGDSTGLIIFAPLLILMLVNGLKETLDSILNSVTIGIIFVTLAIFFYMLAISPVENALRFIYLIIIPIFFSAFGLKIKNVFILLVAAQFMLAAAFVFRNSPYYRVIEIQLMILIISSVVIYVSMIIIERREFETKARMIATSRNLATISGIILHEIAQPITALITYSQIQLNALDNEDEIDKTKIKSYAKSINDEIVRVRDLFIKIKDGIRHDNEITDPLTNVVELMKSACEQIQPSANAVGVNVRLNIKDEVIYISVLPQNFNIAVRNLLTNAVQSASASKVKKCDIDLYQSSDLCFIDFTDSGERISKNKLKKLFDYGFSDSGIGLGIGLSIAKDLIEISKGNIIAFDNKNLKFRIIFPKAYATKK